MDNLVKNIKRNMWLRAAAFIILGILIAFKPAMMINISIQLIALYLAILGIYSLVTGLKTHQKGESLNSAMILGITELVGALFVWLFAKSLLSLLPFVIGIGLLVHGINYIMQIRSNRQYVNVSPVMNYVYGALIIVAAVVMIFNPFKSLTVLFAIFGWLLIIMGIAEIFGTRLFK
jgi:uncharacterized membrane protein HdeD (DUF308 family)